MAYYGVIRQGNIEILDVKRDTLFSKIMVVLRVYREKEAQATLKLQNSLTYSFTLYQQYWRQRSTTWIRITTVPLNVLSKGVTVAGVAYCIDAFAQRCFSVDTKKHETLLAVEPLPPDYMQTVNCRSPPSKCAEMLFCRIVHSGLYAVHEKYTKICRLLPRFSSLSRPYRYRRPIREP